MAKVDVAQTSAEYKTCTKCNETKPTSEFGKLKRGLHSWCKKCLNAKNAAYQRTNKEKNKTSSLPTEKYCHKCKETKPASEFSRNGTTPEGLSRYCKMCSADLQKSIRYGLTPEEYAAMLEAQGGRCKICRDPHGRLCVDHNHETGKVRGLLCNHCNRGLGAFRDRMYLLHSAIVYLRAA